VNGSSSLEMRELDPGRFARTWQVIREGIAEGVAPGMVAGLWDARNPSRIEVAALGKRRAFPKDLPELPMLPETIFDLASLTKIMGTASLAATLVERRWIDWRTPVAAILPECRCEGVEIRHLLSHTAGFVAWEPLWERMRERFGGSPLWRIPVPERQRAMRELVMKSRPEVRPGERTLYSDISFLLLGFALEEVTQMPLDRAIRHFVWQPMSLETVFFRHVTGEAARSRLDQVAATEDSEWRGGVLQGQVHDDNCWAMGGYAGHAGAFGSVRDVLAFARAWVPREGYRGFVSSETLRAAWTRVSEPAGSPRTLGWDTPSGEDSSAGRLFSRRSVGHLGYTGTSLWIDPDAGVAVTLLTNRVHPTRENPRMKAFRPRFHDAIRMDLAR
jgi:CubicO group peptidase (beta-lactamase class C family)